MLEETTQPMTELEKELTRAYWPTESPPTPDVLEQPMEKLEEENLHALGIDHMDNSACFL
jgi:hypothetical protein